MTTLLDGDAIAVRLEDSVPGSVEGWDAGNVWVKPEAVLDVCRFLKEDSDLDMNYLVAVSRWTI